MATLANGHDVNDDLRDRAAEFRRLDSARDDFCLVFFHSLLQSGLPLNLGSN